MVLFHLSSPVPSFRSSLGCRSLRGRGIAIRAAGSRRARTRRRASPSSTRWSNVTDTCPIGRATISPSRTTGRSAIRWTPRMPTSGWLISGVTNEPENLPALVTVNVEPRSSSGFSVPCRAPSASRAPRHRARRASASRSRGRPGRRDPVVGVDRDAEVVALEVDDLVALEPGVQLGKLLERRGDGLEHRRHEPVEVDVPKSHSSTHVTAGIDCARVMCSAITRRTPRNRSRRPSGPRSGPGQCRGRTSHVLFGHTTLRPGSSDVLEIDAELRPRAVARAASP